MSDSGWVVPNFYKAPQDSLFDKEYDYESTIKVRLISVKLNDNTNEILMTSLLDSKKYNTKKNRDFC